MTDFRASAPGRRQSWFGLKKHVKRAASYRLPHALLRGASRFLPALRSGRLPAPKKLAEVTGRVDGATFVMLRPDRCEIAKELYWGSGRRPKPQDAYALDVVVRLVRDADVFIDVGAYTGIFTLATTSVNPRLTAHAFEIVPAVAELLERNVERNRVSDRVRVHREGVGTPDATMVIPRGEGGSALPSFYSSRMTFQYGVTVGFRSLDSLDEIMAANDRVVMKIDVEGTEADIFRHGATFLGVHRPEILCEVLHGQADFQTLNEILAPLGYQFYLVRERDIVRRLSVSPHPFYRDWLFSHRDEHDLRSLGLGVTAADP